MSEKCYSRKKDHVWDIPQHTVWDVRMSCASILGQFSRNLRAQTQLWLGPTPFILGTIEFLHHHLTVGGAFDDGRTEISGELSSLGVSVYHGISVYPDTINSQVLSYGLKPFYKAPVLCTSNLSDLQITLACLIDLLLVTNVHAREFGGNERIHILNGLQPWRMIYFASSFGSCCPMSLSSLRISLEVLSILRSTVWGSEKIHFLHCWDNEWCKYLIVTMPWQLGKTWRKPTKSPRLSPRSHLQHTLPQESLLVTIAQLQCLSVPKISVGTSNQVEVSNLSQRSTLVRTGTWSLNIGSTFTNQKRKGTNFEGCRLIDAGGSTTRHSCPEERGFCTQIHLQSWLLWLIIWSRGW